MNLRKLQRKLKESKLDGCILDADDPNFKYYTQSFLFEGKLFIPQEGKPTIFAHALEDLEHNFNVVRMMEKDTFEKSFKKKLKVAFNPSFTSVSSFNKLKKIFNLVEFEDELENIRTIKTEREIQYLKKAASLADKLMQKIIKNLKRFKTEGDVKRFLKTEMAKLGLEESFEPLIASGRGAAIPHYFGDKKLANGFIIVDLGVKWKGYCSDITRTFYKGKPNHYEKKIYNDILNIQKKCIEMCEKETKCSDAYNFCKAQLGEKFTHGLGHGIGLKIHELPNLKEGMEDVFENNMVFTVEPGWYDEEKKIGIRIEDDVMIKQGKPIVLTKTTKELICF